MATLGITPTPLMAYGLRLLNDAYTGNAVQVSNGTTTQDIGFISGVLDTASLMTFAGSGDARITIWYDQSGGGLNATQTTYPYAPALVLGGTLQTMLGEPCANFQNNTNLTVASAFANQPFTVLSPIQVFNTSNYVSIFQSGGAGGVSLGLTPSGALDLQRSGHSDTPSATLLPFGDPHMLTWVSAAGYDSLGDAVTVTPWLDTAQTADVTHNDYSSVGTTANTTVIGFLGLLTELVFWPTALSNTDRAAAELNSLHYLGQGYGIVTVSQDSLQVLMSENPDLIVSQMNLQVLVASPPNAPVSFTENMANTAVANSLALVMSSAQDAHRPVGAPSIDGTWTLLGSDTNAVSGRAVVAGSRLYADAATQSNATVTFPDNALQRVSFVEIIVS